MTITITIKNEEHPVAEKFGLDTAWSWRVSKSGERFAHAGGAVSAEDAARQALKILEGESGK